MNIDKLWKFVIIVIVLTSFLVTYSKGYQNGATDTRGKQCEVSK